MNERCTKMNKWRDEAGNVYTVEQSARNKRFMVIRTNPGATGRRRGSLEVNVRFDINYGMAGKGHNGENQMWLGRCWGYWLPRLQWNGGRVSRGECCDIAVLWLYFWVGMTVWNEHNDKGKRRGFSRPLDPLVIR